MGSKKIIKYFYFSLINLYNLLNLKNKKEKIFFYSESKFYTEHFADLIENLLELKIDNLTYVTSDYDDYLYHKNKLESYFVGNGFFLHLFFQLLECKMMIMTLANLGDPIKKSPKCKNYVYFFHALSNTYKAYTSDAFKEYDTILTVGNFQKIELIESEKKYNYQPKKIINTGYFFLDHIKNKIRQDKMVKSNILFAPSWNYKENLFDDYSIKIIEELIAKNFIVTLRPHPEHYKRSKKTISKIIEKFENNKNFLLDQNPSNILSMEKSEMLITDNSAIDMEYVLLFKRPVIHIKYVERIHNDKINDFSMTTIEEEFKKIFGNQIHIHNLKELSNLINDLKNSNNDLEDKVNLFKEKYISNIGNSSKFAANYLVKELG